MSIIWEAHLSRFRTAVIVRVNNSRWVSARAPRAWFTELQPACSTISRLGFLLSISSPFGPQPHSPVRKTDQLRIRLGVVPAMAAGRAMPRLAIGILVLALSSRGVPALTFDASDDLSFDGRRVGSPAASAGAEQPAAPAQAVEAPLAPTQGRALGANPLWAIPLSALSNTRERPIFSSSRRPPASAVAAVVKPAAVVPKPKDPERPKLSLVGTVAGGHERFGIFLDQSTKAALRLRMGDDYQGWRLRSVEGREATLEKDQQAVILALPEPGAGRPVADIAPLPSNAATLLSAATSSRRERSSH